MRDQRTRACAGCGRPVPMRDPTRRSWCDSCGRFQVDLKMIERARDLLARCDIPVAAGVINEALEHIRERLRAGDIPLVLLARDRDSRARYLGYMEARDERIGRRANGEWDADDDPVKAPEVGFLIPFRRRSTGDEL